MTATHETDQAQSVLVLLRHYLPGFKFGGQLRSVSNIVGALGGKIAFRIGCLDRDTGDVEPYPGIGAVAQVDGAEVHYLRPGGGVYGQLIALLRSKPLDTLYINGFLDATFSIFPIFAMWAGLVPRRRVIIAPRGEFYPGALAINGTKKQVFLFVARLLGLYRRVLWHATASDEIDYIAQATGASRESIKLVPVIPAVARLDPQALQRPAHTPFRVVFTSRLSRKKNLGYALEVLSRLSVPVHFTVAGMAESDGYWDECAKRAAALPPHVQFTFLGAVRPEAIPALLADNDVFLFPTLGENFGHVIFEALNAGLPVVLSDLTPWRGLEAAGVGYDLSLDDPEKFVAALERLAALPAAEFGALRQRAYAYSMNWFAAQTSVRDMQLLLAGK